MRDTINIPKLGELEIIEMYEYFNGPIIFACMNYATHLYIGIYSQRLPEHEMWLFAEVSPMRLSLVRSGEISLHHAFAKPETDRLLQAMIPHSYSKSAELNTMYVDPNELKIDVFPSTDNFLDFKDVPAFMQTYSVDSLKLAKSLEREIIEVKLDYYEEYKTEASLHSVGRIFTCIQNIVNTISMVETKLREASDNIQDAMQLSILAFERGSFNIKVASKKPNMELFESDTTIQHDVISEFINLLQSKDNRSEFKEWLIELKPEVAKKYKTLLQSLDKSESNTTFSWASPNLSEQKRVFFSKNEIPNLIHTLNTFQDEYSDQFTVIGRFNMLDFGNRKFEIIADGKSYKGRYLKDVDKTINNATMNLEYNALIQKLSKRNLAINKVVKTEYILHKLEQTDEVQLETEFF